MTTDHPARQEAVRAFEAWAAAGEDQGTRWARHSPKVDQGFIAGYCASYDARGEHIEALEKELASYKGGASGSVAYVVVHKDRPVRVLQHPSDADFEAFCLGGRDRKDVSVKLAMFGPSISIGPRSDTAPQSATLAQSPSAPQSTRDTHETYIDGRDGYYCRHCGARWKKSEPEPPLPCVWPPSAPQGEGERGGLTGVGCQHEWHTTAIVTSAGERQGLRCAKCGVTREWSAPPTEPDGVDYDIERTVARLTKANDLLNAPLPAEVAALVEEARTLLVAFGWPNQIVASPQTLFLIDRLASALELSARRMDGPSVEEVARIIAAVLRDDQECSPMASSADYMRWANDRCTEAARAILALFNQHAGEVK